MQNELTPHPSPMQAEGAQLRPLPELETTIRAAAVLELQGALTVGVCLAEAKQQLTHGEWMPWLRKMGISPSYAERRMRLAAEIPPESPLASLSYTQAMAVLALPAGEREAFVLENGVADKSGAEIKKLIKEKEDALRERNVIADAYEKASMRAARAEKEAFELKQRMENTEPCTVKVVETPDDYQQLKMAAAHHQAEMEEAAQAAEEAEQRAARAEAELARMRMQGGGKAPDKMEKVAGLANDFLIAAQLLPYDREIMGSAQGRRQCELVVKQIRAWVLDMQQALEFGPLDAEGAVI